MDIENVPVVTPDSSVAPVAPVTPEQSPAPEAAPIEVPQYELPDGTKVDPETLAKSWKEQFMPEYTRKSQELAALKQKLAPKEQDDAPKTNPLDNPEWQPTDYKELSSAIEQKVWNQILESASAEERQAQERDEYIKQEITEIQSLDKDVDVNRVMAHAAKYRFASLIPAYQNLKAIEDAARLAEERVLKNIQARSSAPVGAPTAGGQNIAFPPDVKTGLDKARYILRNQ